MKRRVQHNYASLSLKFILFCFLLIGTLEAQGFSSPTLVSPANSATNVATSLSLQWNSVSTATSYSVQVATDSGFTKLVVNQSGLTSTSYQVTGLSSNTTYYWHAGASTLILFSGWSSAWSFTTAPAPPPLPNTPTLISPADGSTNQPATIVLNWNAATNATHYWVQIATNSSFSNLIVSDSSITATSYQANGLASSTTYYWRVEGLNSAGSSSWSSVWSFTTAAPAPLPLPNTPTLISPADSSTNQPATIVLNWNAATNATHYWVQIATNSSFSNPTIGDSSITSTSYQANGLASSTTYYWRVEGLNSAGSSRWSSVWSFTTVSTQIQPPPQPTLAAPTNAATNQPTTLTLSWNPSTNADHYWIQVATDQTFSNMVFTNYTIVGTTQQITGLTNNTTYYWQVRAVNAGGQSSWSSQWNFTTAVSPPQTLSAPVLVAPGNGITNQPTAINFKWDSVSNATKYHFQLSTSSSFSPLISDNPNVADTSQNLILLSNNQLYYWRVSASNSSSSSIWSNVWSFTTAALPLPPTLVAPPNDTTLQPENITFAWNVVPNADHYHIQVSTTPSFDSLIINDSSLTIATKQIDSLSPNQIYYWRVSAKDSATNGQWSNARIVKTSSKPASTLAAPNPVSPANGAVNQPTTLTLLWSSVSGASSYSLEVATDAAFNNIVVNQSGLSNTYYQVTNLSNGITYYWRAGASSLILFSGWSSTWNFTTIPATVVLTPPMLISPVNGAIRQLTTLTFKWDSTANAVSYNLVIATDSLYHSIAQAKYNITTTSEQITGLQKSTIYYWHVNAVSQQDTSLFSTTWNFQTYSDSVYTPIPSVPTLLSPADNSTNEPLYPILSWNKSTNALFYTLEAAKDTLFKNLIFNDSVLTQTYYQIGQLNYNTEYYWRVNARDSAGASNWSSVWQFTTQNYSSTTPALVSPADGATNEPLSVACIWDSISSASFYDLEISDSANFSSLIYNDSTSVNTSEVVGNLIGNTNYFWRVRSKSNGSWSAFSSAWRFTTMAATPTYINIDTTILFPSYSSMSQFKSTDYKIVGLPGAGNIPLRTFLTGQIGQGWEAYWDNGAPNNYFVAYGKGNEFVFAPGEAFWIIKNGSLIIDTTVENVPLNSNGNVDISLHSGWNLITDPFNYPVSWSQVQTKNSTSENIYAFNGTFQISKTLAPYIGYYYFNGTGSTTLEISPMDTLLPPLARINSSDNTNSSNDGWQVNMKLKAGNYADSAACFGVSFDATKEFNKMDLHKPRNMESVPEIYFSHPEWNKNYPIFASDIKPLFENYEEWSFEVASSPQQKAAVSFSGLDEIPRQFNVYLHDVQSDKWIDLRMENSYRFLPSDATTSFKIVVGTEQAIKNKIGNINTSDVYSYKLGNNYPNPFNLTTIIPLTLDKQSNVELEIFNIIGQKVKTIYSGALDSGRHFFRWDGTDNNGRIVSSGIYFYRLDAPQYPSLIKKMILLK